MLGSFNYDPRKVDKTTLTRVDGKFNVRDNGAVRKAKGDEAALMVACDTCVPFGSIGSESVDGD